VIAHLSNILNHRKRNEDASLLRYWRGVSIHAPGAGCSMRFRYVDWMVDDAPGAAGTAARASDMYTNEFNPFTELDH